MKTILLLVFSLLFVAELSAQQLYIPGKITKGETAAYYCKLANKLILEVRNVKNVDTTDVMYYKDGRPMPIEADLSGSVDTKPWELLNAFRECLTPEEWNMLKGKVGHFLGMDVVADSDGNTLEIVFQFRTADPVMTKMDPDRLYRLEQNLKKIIKMTPSKEDRAFKSIKYLQFISYAKIK